MQKNIVGHSLYLQVLVGLNERFTVGDHDFSRESIIPSVVLNISIPETASESVYTGRKVTVTLKDAVFQASDAFR